MIRSPMRSADKILFRKGKNRPADAERITYLSPDTESIPAIMAAVVACHNINNENRMVKEVVRLLERGECKSFIAEETDERFTGEARAIISMAIVEMMLHHDAVIAVLPEYYYPLMHILPSHMEDRVGVIGNHLFHNSVVNDGGAEHPLSMIIFSRGTRHLPDTGFMPTKDNTGLEIACTEYIIHDPRCIAISLVKKTNVKE